MSCCISHQAPATSTTSPWCQHSLLPASSRPGWSGASVPTGTRGSSVRAVLLATGETLPAWGRSASACPAVAKGEEFVTRTLVRGVVSTLFCTRIRGGCPAGRGDSKRLVPYPVLPPSGECYSGDENVGNSISCPFGFYRDPRPPHGCRACPCNNGQGCSVVLGREEVVCDHCPPGAAGNALAPVR